ncbi:MAG: 3-methyl-2-oxobutanoate hydroxymethyltransferase [Spirochaetes bacterium]|nr:3-methyl-2-oxobutanoate hydroxymethyltransferase [Spirochaetota bacterium]MBU0955917.1 3-methyl-2-oxobutanoate hydroxymethyltransferase [Spirochaetota bacterium]
MFTIPDFKAAKEAGRRIAMLTCYDVSTAAILQDAGIDAVLVGDSVAMVVHGHPSTTTATIDMIETHIRAVRSGAPDLCVVGDMPFLSTRRGLAAGVDAAGALIRAGANAVKIEGLSGHEELIPALVGGGVPVMGHLGLLPQSVNVLGGYSKRGKDVDEADRIVQDARELERLGCFAMVLECIPAKLAARIQAEVGIPTIGIGAGLACDGQILVSNDMLGLTAGYVPAFAKRYLNAHELFRQAFTEYIEEVRQGEFPPAGKAAVAAGGTAGGSNQA